MGDRSESVSSTLSLNAVDTRATYYPSSRNEKSLSSFSAAAANPTTSALCMLISGRRIQQRYKLLTDGLIQVCRVPHAKNIIEKIRFSRFLRRWEDHYINLEHNEILSKTVSFNSFFFNFIYFFFIE